MKKNLAEEIFKNASEIPLECQELVLDNIKAMLFTKKVIQKTKNNEPKQTA